MYEDKPTLYFNRGKEHSEAYELMLESGIEFEKWAPADIEEPTLLVGFVRYVGLREIKKFIEKYKSRKANK